MMPAPLHVAEDYTVGWICAVVTEYVAAKEFLDGPPHRLDRITLAANNRNEYTLGSISNHNVVISVLPMGGYGTVSAARVAEDMTNSFPNIRIGLMVGIGGGAPSQKHDIRLGDIVVGVPSDGKGGVFQYDFGKMTQGQCFRPTGFLSSPPIVLLSAVNGLRAQYEIEGHQINEHIDNILKRNPRLLNKYKRPDPENDRLYQSQFVHPESGCPCAETSSNDFSNLVSRAVDTEDRHRPIVHYGLVGSANQLMEDALVRDKLAADPGVLCFEMEAAGLMNSFPCIVIRGICDYADTHRNDSWQGYAAMVAAAYARDLLCKIPPQAIRQECRIVKIQEQGYRHPPARIENHHWYFDVSLDSDSFNRMSTGRKRVRDLDDLEDSSSSSSSDRRKKTREESPYADSVFDDYDPDYNEDHEHKSGNPVDLYQNNVLDDDDPDDNEDHGEQSGNLVDLDQNSLSDDHDQHDNEDREEEFGSFVDLCQSSEGTRRGADSECQLNYSENEDSVSEDRPDETSQETRQGPEVWSSNEADSEDSEGSDETTESSSDSSQGYWRHYD